MITWNDHFGGKAIYVICHGGLKVKTFIVAEARLMYE